MKAKSRKAAHGARSHGARSHGARKRQGAAARGRVASAASVKKTALESASVPSRKRLLQVGLDAFSLPGAESAMTEGLSKLADSLGFKKLEGVFDQRVAGALLRLGYPSPLALQSLLAKSEQPNRSSGRRKAGR